MIELSVFGFNPHFRLQTYLLILFIIINNRDTFRGFARLFFLRAKRRGTRKKPFCGWNEKAGIPENQNINAGWGLIQLDGIVSEFGFGGYRPLGRVRGTSTIAIGFWQATSEKSVCVAALRIGSLPLLTAESRQNRAVNAVNVDSCFQTHLVR